MLATLLLLAFVTATTVTDVRHHKIYNSTTYTGILAALVVAGCVSVWGSHDDVSRWLGEVPLVDAMQGLLVCGGAMLVCYVFFKIGGGDVKLIAMLGAFMGVREGIATMLWTFVIGGASALIVLVWKIGTWNLLRRFIGAVLSVFGRAGPAGTGLGLGEDGKTSLFLAPSALAAVILVHFKILDNFGLVVF